MKLTRYLYSGPQSAACLRTDDGLLDVQLCPGKPVELPAGHEYTKVLLELQHLKPLSSDPKPAKPGAGEKSEGGQANAG